MGAKGREAITTGGNGKPCEISISVIMQTAGKSY